MHAQLAKENSTIVTRITSGNTEKQLRLLALSAFCIAFTITFMVKLFSGMLVAVLVVQFIALYWVNYSFRNYFDLVLQQNGDHCQKLMGLQKDRHKDRHQGHRA